MLAKLPSMFLFIVLAFIAASLACSDLSKVGIPGIGKCHSIENGEVLNEVEDEIGNLFTVEKTTRLTTGGENKDYCGVSVRAELGREKGIFDIKYVYHPETGDKIYAAFSDKGLLMLDGYEWY